MSRVRAGRRHLSGKEGVQAKPPFSSHVGMLVAADFLPCWQSNLRDIKLTGYSIE